MDIGSKIRQSRNEAKITQESAAEQLGVSRQTISNWENGKSYPDIISVLKMSDLYNVSLDYLLKGETNMNSYMNYLDESTNEIKSRNKFSKLLLIVSYLVIWAFAILVFWFFSAPDAAMLYSIVFLWIILPVATFIISLLISRNNYWGKWKWLGSVIFGVMYMLAEYATFSMANNVAADKINIPNFSMILVGIIISLIGMGIGHLIYKNRMEFGMICIILGILFIGCFIYLMPATMWINFSLAFLIIGVVLLIVGIILIKKNKSKENS